jgi:hypothetical protein
MIGTGALFLLLGTLAPAYAQQEENKKEEAKPAKQEEKAKPAKQEERAQPAKQEEKAKPVKQEEKAQPAKQEEKAKPAKQEEKAQPAKQEEKAQPAKQEANAKQATAEQHPQQVQRTKQAEERQRAEPALRLSVNTHSRIPEEHFRSNFGREHRFRIDSPRIVDGYSRFQYSGFWFGFVESWPGDWYYTDDVYVDYVDGGYYLYNPYHPGIRIGISVVL